MQSFQRLENQHDQMRGVRQSQKGGGGLGKSEKKKEGRTAQVLASPQLWGPHRGDLEPEVEDRKKKRRLAGGGRGGRGERKMARTPLLASLIQAWTIPHRYWDVQSTLQGERNAHDAGRPT